MEKKSENLEKSGFLLINKPVGITSHDVVDQLRKITGIKKIGHAGTLDPFASGLLIMAIGRSATKQISQFVKLDKEYVATLHLGATTDTYDVEGNKEISNFEFRISNEDIVNILSKFTGKQKQVPPMFSAKKVKGKKLYELARKGIEIERAPVDIEIFDIKLLEYKWPFLKIATHVSSGTYIRSLGHDIGQALGCGAYLEELKRTAVGEFRLEDSIKIEKLKEDNWEASIKRIKLLNT